MEDSLAEQPVLDEEGAGPMIRRVFVSPCGGTGRRGKLKICCPQGRAGSSPARGTNEINMLPNTSVYHRLTSTAPSST